MASNDTVNNGVNQLDQTISTASDINSSDIQNAAEAITNAVSSLGDGLKLTTKSEKKESLNEENNKKEENLKEQLDGLRIFAPELADMVDMLLEINVNSENFFNKNSKKAGGSKKSKEPKAVGFKTDARESRELDGLVNLADIAGTGFSIVGNILSDLYTLFDTVLQGVAAGQIAQALVQSTAPVTTSNIQEEKEEQSQQQSQGILANFFQGLAGPLESVAGSMLMLSIAVSILSTIQINEQLMGTMIFLQAFMLTTFAILNRIKLTQQQNPDLIDTEGTKEGSILNIIREFALMVATTAGTLLLCASLVDTIKENWQNMLLGLVMIFGVAFVTLIALDATALIMSRLLGQEAPITQTVKDFALLVLTISIVTILCSVLEPVITDGLRVASIILTETLGIFLFLGIMMSAVSQSVSAEQLTQFSNIIKNTTILIGILAVMTVILGVIPTDIITQGLIAVTLITALVDVMFVMLDNAIGKMEGISVEALTQLRNILIVSTVLIGLLGVLTVVLGLMPTEVIVQGLIAITLISAIPIVLIEVMAKVGQKSAQMVQALLGVAIAGVITLAVTGVAYLIVNAFSKFEMSQVLTAMLAVTLTTALLIGVGAAAVVLGAYAIPLAYATPFALAGIGLTSVLALAIAGVAYLLATILQPEVAQNAIVAAGAITLTATALVVVGSASIALAALSVPLALTSRFAINAINILSNFLIVFANTMVVTLNIITTSLSGIDLTGLENAIQVIVQTTMGLVLLSTTLLAFNSIAALLVLQISLATVELGLIDVGLLALILKYRSMAFILTRMPQDNLSLEPLTNAIEELNSFSEVINNFTAPSATKMIQMGLVMNFATNFAKRLGSIGDDNTITRITNLANNLSTLAQNATSLSSLASSIREVAEATKELNSIQGQTSKISIESVTGGMSKFSDLLKGISKPKEESNTENLTENLNQVISLLQTIADNSTDTNTSLQSIADEQATVVRRGDSNSIQSTFM